MLSLCRAITLFALPCHYLVRLLLMASIPSLCAVLSPRASLSVTPSVVKRREGCTGFSIWLHLPADRVLVHVACCTSIRKFNDCLYSDSMALNAATTG